MRLSGRVVCPSIAESGHNSCDCPLCKAYEVHPPAHRLKALGEYVDAVKAPLPLF